LSSVCSAGGGWGMGGKAFCFGGEATRHMASLVDFSMPNGNFQQQMFSDAILQDSVPIKFQNWSFTVHRFKIFLKIKKYVKN
jgi:hypothetical protein